MTLEHAPKEIVQAIAAYGSEFCSWVLLKKDTGLIAAGGDVEGVFNASVESLERQGISVILPPNIRSKHRAFIAMFWSSDDELRAMAGGRTVQAWRSNSAVEAGGELIPIQVNTLKFQNYAIGFITEGQPPESSVKGLQDLQQALLQQTLLTKTLKKFGAWISAIVLGTSALVTAAAEAVHQIQQMRNPEAPAQVRHKQSSRKSNK